jgi:hypothetical protein
LDGFTHFPALLRRQGGHDDAADGEGGRAGRIKESNGWAGAKGMADGWGKGERRMGRAKGNILIGQAGDESVRVGQN